MRLRTVLAGALIALAPSLGFGQVQPGLPGANEVYAGPTSGPAAQPSFRALVPADLGSALTSAAVDAAFCSTTNAVLLRGASAWACQTTLPAALMPGLTGDVTSSTGSIATAIVNGAVTNAKLANMAAAGIKGATAAGPVADLTGLQAGSVLQFLQAGTGAVQRSIDSWAKAQPIHLTDFGPISDAQFPTVAVTETSGTATLTVGSAVFASTDCQGGTGCTGTLGNKTIVVPGAGAGGAPFFGMITSFTSPTQVGVSANFGTSQSAVSQVVMFGHDNTMAIQNWLNQCQSSQQVCYADAGSWGLASGLNVTNAAGVAIEGAGQRSIFIAMNPNADFMDVNTNASVLVKSIEVVGVQQGNGVGVNHNLFCLTGPAQNFGSVFFDVVLAGGNEQVGNCFSGNLALFYLTNSSLFGSVSRPVVLGNNGNPLSGGYLLTGNNIGTNRASNSSNSGLDCILLVSGGNLAVTNSMVHFCQTSVTVQSNVNSLTIGDIFLVGNSFEQNTIAAVHLNRGNIGSAVQAVQIIGNDMAGGTPSCIVDDGTNANYIQDVTITGNSCYPNNAGGINLTNAFALGGGGINITGNHFATGGGTTTGINISGNAVGGRAKDNTFRSLTTDISNSSPLFLAEDFVNGHTKYVGVAPTLGTCSATASVDAGSTDMDGGVSIGGTATSSCTVNFAKAFNAAPKCVCSQYGGTSNVCIEASPSTSALTLFFASAANVSYNWKCSGT